RSGPGRGTGTTADAPRGRASAGRRFCWPGPRSPPRKCCQAGRGKDRCPGPARCRRPGGRCECGRRTRGAGRTPPAPRPRCCGPGRFAPVRGAYSCLQSQLVVLRLEGSLVASKSVLVAAATDPLEDGGEGATASRGGAIRLGSVDRLAVVDRDVAGLKADT